MYTQEQRRKAVLLFVESGFNHALVKRTFGFPHRHTLDIWYRDYLEKGYVKERRTRWEKFTEEQKKAAVDAFLANGCNASKTVSELGYPSRPVLAKWADELAPGARKRQKPRRRTTLEERLEIVARSYSDDPKTVKAIADEAGIHEVTLYNWRNEILGGDIREEMGGLADSELPDDIGELRRMIDEQRAELRRLQLETAVWKGAAELVKKDRGADPGNLTNREKTVLIGALRDRFALRELLAAVGLSKSSYFYQVHAMEASDKYADLRKRIAEIFMDNSGNWGYRRIWGALRTADDPVVVSEKVVRTIMAQEGLAVAYAKKKKKHWSSYAGEISEAPTNLVERDFHADSPNELWLTDITQFSVNDFKCYLSPIIDCFDGAVVSWRISRNPNADLVNGMLDEAIGKLAPGQEPVCHSDRGAHYRWPGWIARCGEAGITRSMSKKGCSPDNSACEGFFGRLKNEFFYYRDWEGVSYDEFVRRLNGYIEYYNERRIKQSLGWLSPMQYRRSLGLTA